MKTLFVTTVLLISPNLFSQTYEQNGYYVDRTTATAGASKTYRTIYDYYYQEPKAEEVYNQNGQLEQKKVILMDLRTRKGEPIYGDSWNGATTFIYGYEANIDYIIRVDKTYDVAGRLNYKPGYYYEVEYFDATNKQKHFEGFRNSNEQKEGEWVTYFEDGRQEIVETFDKGIQNGPYMRFYENKSNVTKLEEGPYENGKKEGEWISYYASGHIKESSIYKQGIRSGQYTSYYDNDTGNITETGNYLDGKRQGAWKFYYPSGNLNLAQSYKEGILDGAYTNYFDESVLRIYQKGDMKKGLEIGVWECYNTESQRYKKLQYDGVHITPTELK